jgi:putative ABC transport system permease protein
VTPDFFETLGDRVVMGRSITAEDSASTRPVAVINEAFARRFFARENPVGQHFGPGSPKNAGMYEIVGVVSDVDFGNGQQPMYFLPEAQNTWFLDPEAEEREVLSHYLSSVVLWAPDNPPGLQLQVKKAVAGVDPNLVMTAVQPYSEIIQADFTQQNMIASLTELFGAIGLVLAAVGLYGVTAYGVEQRTREIGVRMALGANRRDVVRTVLRDAFWQIGFGVALGIPAAISAGYLTASHLFGMTPWSPGLLGMATLLLIVTAFAAAMIPARRAAGVDPMRVLRME